MHELCCPSGASRVHHPAAFRVTHQSKLVKHKVRLTRAVVCCDRPSIDRNRQQHSAGYAGGLRVQHPHLSTAPNSQGPACQQKAAGAAGSATQCQQYKGLPARSYDAAVLPTALLIHQRYRPQTTGAM
mmetsp:Transcript_28324/g.62185  ORF Transcript_28324/g.62185 Transcript_28324/m.62185 type:complete len:128 (-) Transcript_28324:124-507(-)